MGDSSTLERTGAERVSILSSKSLASYVLHAMDTCLRLMGNKPSSLGIRFSLLSFIASPLESPNCFRINLASRGRCFWKLWDTLKRLEGPSALVEIGFEAIVTKAKGEMLAESLPHLWSRACVDVDDSGAPPTDGVPIDEGVNELRSELGNCGILWENWRESSNRLSGSMDMLIRRSCIFVFG